MLVIEIQEQLVRCDALDQFVFHTVVILVELTTGIHKIADMR